MLTYFFSKKKITETQKTSFNSVSFSSTTELNKCNFKAFYKKSISIHLCIKTVWSTLSSIGSISLQSYTVM